MPRWREFNLIKNMRKDLSISVVIPAYNEAAGIGLVLAAIPDYVDEIVVVDNNCKDNTAEVARQCGARVVTETTQGYGASLRRGFQAARGDIIVTMDADGTYPAEVIGDMVDLLADEKLDFISCARFPLTNPHSMSRRNAFGNQVLNVCFALLFGRWLRDSQSGMWVFRRRILPLMHFVGTSWEFSSEIKIEACTNPYIRFREVHIDYHPRVGFSHFHAWSKAIAVGIHDIKFLIAQRFVNRRARQERSFQQQQTAPGPLEPAA